MSRDIVGAARRYFGVSNAGILETDRVQLHYGDGRNHLLLTDAQYDLITIELTSIWIAGEADLYNKEFYGYVRAHLAPHGVMQQWVQLHHMPRKEMAVVLASVRSQFPHVALFVGGGQGQILASMDPIEINYRKLTDLSQQLRGRFATYLVPGGDLLTLYGELVLDEVGVEKFIAQEAERDGIPVDGLVSTDDNLALEYGTPKGNALQVDSMTLFLRQFHRLGPANLPVQEMTGAHAAEHVQAARLAGAGDLKGAAQILAAFDEPETKDLKEWLAQQQAKVAPR
jgi:spermidine synthase